MLLDVSHDRQGDWQLVVQVNGQPLVKQAINAKSCPQGWGAIKMDLSKYAGQEIRLDFVNSASGWSYEFAYWGGFRLLSE